MSSRWAEQGVATFTHEAQQLHFIDYVNLSTRRQDQSGPTVRGEATDTDLDNFGDQRAATSGVNRKQEDGQQEEEG